MSGWRKKYYCSRAHSSLGYRPPAPEAMRLKNLLKGSYIDQGQVIAALERM